MSQKKFGILCFAPGFGGLEMNTLRLAQWMQADGWTVPLLFREESALQQKSATGIYRVTTIKADYSRLQELRAIHRWVQQERLDVLLIPFNKDIKTAALYKRLYNRRIRLIYQQHMQVGVRKRDLVHTLRYNMLDAWISPLPYLKAETLEKTRVPAAKIHIIPFGLEPGSFTRTTWTKSTARAAFRLPEEPRLIGVLGRIDPKKGQDLVIKGIHALREQHNRDYHLLLLGDATLNEGDAFSMQLKKLVTDHHLEDRVHFRAYQPDIMQFFRAIDVFAMPSHGETFGMVTLEAMAAGVPVTGTDRDGTREILQNGTLGYLFPLNDVAAFCHQIIRIETDPDLPQVLQQAREEIRVHYTKEAMCRSVAALVSSLSGQ